MALGRTLWSQKIVSCLLDLIFFQYQHFTNPASACNILFGFVAFSAYWWPCESVLCRLTCDHAKDVWARSNNSVSHVLPVITFVKLYVRCGKERDRGNNWRQQNTPHQWGACNWGGEGRWQLACRGTCLWALCAEIQATKECGSGEDHSRCEEWSADHYSAKNWTTKKTRMLTDLRLLAQWTKLLVAHRKEHQHLLLQKNLPKSALQDRRRHQVKLQQGLLLLQLMNLASSRNPCIAKQQVTQVNWIFLPSSDDTIVTYFHIYGRSFVQIWTDINVLWKIVNTRHHGSSACLLKFIKWRTSISNLSYCKFATQHQQQRCIDLQRCFHARCTIMAGPPLKGP